MNDTTNRVKLIAQARRKLANGDVNRVQEEDRAAHEWYRFVLSFPPHLVDDYLDRWGIHEGQCVLDPFCGTGTTVVECKKRRISSVGIEANPVAHFASSVKVDWGVDPSDMVQEARSVAEEANRLLADDEGIPLIKASPRKFPPASETVLLTDSISPLPLHKVLTLKEVIERHGGSRFTNHFLLALAKISVGVASNLKFRPEVGVGSLKDDAPVVRAWLDAMEAMSGDVAHLAAFANVPSSIINADAREAQGLIPEASIDAVLTSPPYPNEKDYTRTTRLESVLLGFIRDRQDLRALKQGLLRSNTRNVYKADTDDEFVKGFPAIIAIADAIEARRIELGKTSGFERLYARVTKLYFGGMARHLATLRPLLKPGAKLAYVVGDQASYLRVMIRTGTLLADIATTLGYEVDGIDLFRTRLATATKEQLREEVVQLTWKGKLT